MEPQEPVESALSANKLFHLPPTSKHRRYNAEKHRSLPTGLNPNQLGIEIDLVTQARLPRSPTGLPKPHKISQSAKKHQIIPTKSSGFGLELKKSPSKTDDPPTFLIENNKRSFSQSVRTMYPHSNTPDILSSKIRTFITTSDRITITPELYEGSILKLLLEVSSDYVNESFSKICPLEKKWARPLL